MYITIFYYGIPCTNFLRPGSSYLILDSLPTVTAIIRGPAGRQVWSMQMRQHPRSENVRYTFINSYNNNNLNSLIVIITINKLVVWY